MPTVFNKKRLGELLEKPDPKFTTAPWSLVRVETHSGRDEVVRQSLYSMRVESGLLLVKIVLKADPYPMLQSRADAWVWGEASLSWSHLWDYLEAEIRQAGCSVYSRDLAAMLDRDEAALVQVAYVILNPATFAKEDLS